MQLISISILLALASTTVAVPKYDQCYLSIFHASKDYGHSPDIVEKDCASFLRATVSPCPITETRTIAQTHTAKASTTTLVATVASNNHETRTTDVTLVNTNIESATITVPATAYTTAFETHVHTDTSLQMITSYGTVTITSTSTSYVLIPPAAQPFRFARAANECKPQKWSAHDLSGYAFPCKGPEAYSSSCSCFGVEAMTTTLRPSTTVHSVVQATTVTPTVTAHSTTTIQGPAEVDLHTAMATVQTTVMVTRVVTTTTVIAITNTVDAPVVVTQTTSTLVNDATTTQIAFATVTDTACPIIMASGPMAGQYLSGSLVPDSGFMYWSSDRTNALNWYLEDTLLKSGGLMLLALNDGISNCAIQGGSYEMDTNNYFPMTCSIDNNLILSCRTGSTDDAVNNQFCGSASSNLLVFCAASNMAAGGYSEVTLQFDCADGQQAGGGD